MNTKQKIITKLNLSPLEPEGGFFRNTYVAREKIGSAIYYLIDDQNFSRLHRLKCDEIFHFYSGAPVELIQINEVGELSTTILGSKIKKNEHFQVLVPAGHWQGLKLRDPVKDAFALLGATCFPAYSSELFELGTSRDLIMSFPKHINKITEFLKD